MSETDSVVDFKPIPVREKVAMEVMELVMEYIQYEGRDVFIDCICRSELSNINSMNQAKEYIIELLKNGTVGIESMKKEEFFTQVKGMVFDFIDGINDIDRMNLNRISVFIDFMEYVRTE